MIDNQDLNVDELVAAIAGLGTHGKYEIMSRKRLVQPLQMILRMQRFGRLFSRYWLSSYTSYCVSVSGSLD